MAHFSKNLDESDIGFLNEYNQSQFQQQQIAEQSDRQQAQSKAEADKRAAEGGFFSQFGRGLAGAVAKGEASIARTFGRAEQAYYKIGDTIASKVASKLSGHPVDISSDQNIKGSQWLIDRSKELDDATQKYVGTGKVANITEDIGNTLLYSIPVAGELMAVSNATDALVDSHTTGEKVGGLLNVALNIALSGKAGLVSDILGKETLTTALDKIGLKNFAKALDKEVSVTIREGVKPAGKALTEAATGKFAKTTISEVAKSPITKEGVKRLTYAILNDGTIGSLYQVAYDLKNNQQVSFKDVATGFGYGAATGLALRGAGKGVSAVRDSKWKYEKNAFGYRQMLEDELGGLNKVYHSADIAKNYELAASSAIKKAKDSSEMDRAINALRDISKGRDLVHTQGPIEALDKMGVEVRVIDSQPVNSSGMPVNASYRVENGKSIVEVWKGSPNSVHHESGHAIWDFLDNNLGKIRSNSVKRSVADEIAEMGAHGDTASEKFADAVKQMFMYPNIYEKYPKLRSVIESTYGKILYIPDKTIQSAEASIDREGIAAAIKKQIGMGDAAAQQIAKEVSVEDIAKGKIVIGEKTVNLSDIPKPEVKPPVPPTEPPQTISTPEPPVTPKPEGPRFSKTGEVVTPIASAETVPAGEAKPRYTSKPVSGEGETQINDIEKSPEFQKMIQEKRGGTLTEDEAKSAAQEMIKNGTLNKEMILNAKPRSITTAEGIVATKTVIADEAVRLSKVKETIDLGQSTPEMAADYLKSSEDLVKMVATYRGFTSEAGRALESTKIEISGKQYETAVDSIVKDIEKISPEAAGVMKKILSVDSKGKKIVDAYFNVWYPATLSGPDTLARIGADNIFTVAQEGAVKYVFGNILHPSGYVTDLISFVKGTAQGFRDFSSVWSGKIAPLHDNLRFEGNLSKVQKFSAFVGKMMDSMDRVTTGGYMEMFKNQTRNEMERLGKSMSEEEIAAITKDEFKRIIKQGMPEGTIGDIANLLQKGHQSNNPLVRFTTKFLFPFVKAPANILKMSLDYFPVTSLYRLIKTGIKEGVESSKTLEAVGRLAVGSGLLFGLGDKVTAGDKNDKSSIFITGSGPDDAKQRAVWQKTGARPYSIKVGKYWVPYMMLGPVGTTLAAVGAYSDSKYFSKTGENITNNIMNSTLSWAKAQLDQSYLQGVNNLFSALNSATSAESWVESELASLLPIPAFYKQISGHIKQAAGDRNVRQEKGFIQGVANKSGWYDSYGFDWVAKKVLGDTNYKMDINGAKIPKDAIYQLSWTRDKEDPVTMNLLNNGNTLSPSDTVNGIKLTPDDQMEYAHLFGSSAYNVLGPYFDSKTYKNLPENRRKDEIRYLIESVIKPAVDREFIKNHPDYSGPTKQQKAIETRQRTRFSRQTKLFGKPIAEEAVQEEE